MAKQMNHTNEEIIDFCKNYKNYVEINKTKPGEDGNFLGKTKDQFHSLYSCVDDKFFKELYEKNKI